MLVTQQRGHLTDPSLIKNLHDYIADTNRDCALFRERAASKALEHLWRFVDNDEPDCLTRLQQKHAQELWTQLVTSAVNVLKWRDKRENASGTRISYESWLKQTLGHVAFGVDDLDSYFRQFVDFEQVLYGTELYYRDHFVHVIRVWLIGFLVFRDYLPVGEFRLDLPSGQNRYEPWFLFAECELLAVWTIIALCHDLGYPLERIGGMNAPLRKMLSAVGKAQVQDFAYDLPRQHEFIDNFIVQFISSKLTLAPADGNDQGKKGNKEEPEFKTAIQPKYYLKFSKSFEDLKHGILSCTLLMKQLVYFLESDFDISANQSKTLAREDARQFFIRREILRAIATHTCEEIYHIYAETFSFLLAVCDELQEWGRPTFREMRGQRGPDARTFLLDFGPSRVQILTELRRSNYETDEAVMPPEEFASIAERRIRSLFQRLHKILRSALDVSSRKLHFTWLVDVKYSDTEHVRVSFDMHEKTTRVLIDGRSENWLYENRELLALRLKRSAQRSRLSSE